MQPPQERVTTRQSGSTATPEKVHHDPYAPTAATIQEPPKGFLGSLKYLGPGMVTSAAVVGSGELLTATTLGA